MNYEYLFLCDSKLFSHHESAKTKYWQDEAREFLKFLPKASTTLEVACGEGEFTRVLRSKLSNVEGTDLIDRGGAKYVQNYSQNLIRNEKQEIVEYDLVVIRHGLEHILDYLGAMWNMVRNTRVGGYVAIDYYSAKKFVPSMIHYFHIEILKEIAQKFGCRYVVGSGFDVYTYLLFTKIKKIVNPYEALLVGGGPQGASELWTEALGKPPKEDVE